MSRKIFELKSLVVFAALSVLSLGYVQAQLCTPRQILQCDPLMSGGYRDSVIYQDPNGKIGIGTAPDGKLQVVTANDPIMSDVFNWDNRHFVIGAPSSTGGVGISYNQDVGYGMINALSPSVAWRNLVLQAGGGNVGIGTQNPTAKLHVVGGVLSNSAVIGVVGASTGDVGVQGVSSISAGVLGDTTNPNAPGVLARSAGSSETNPGLTVVGRAEIIGMLKAKVVQITGADFSEKFEVRETNGRREPGMVVAIDPENPGKLVLSTTAYNRRVAGILSGAGGINPGMLMGQPGTLADGDQPVALSGRVYVWADASNGAIVPGDLLTTSNMPGHAMKVTDYTKAPGAMIGKAMTGLAQGRGLVLVLVTLQ